MIIEQPTLNSNQLDVINKCKSHNINSSFLEKHPEIDEFKMYAAYLTYREGHDITKYILDFSLDQLDEIRIGLKDKVDISEFANPNISANEMHMIRLNLLAQSMFKSKLS